MNKNSNKKVLSYLYNVSQINQVTSTKRDKNPVIGTRKNKGRNNTLQIRVRKTRKAIYRMDNKNKFPNSYPNLGVHYFRFHRHPIQLKSSLIKGRL